MIDAKVAMFEKKRRDKVSVVKQERNAIIKFALRKESPEKGHGGGASSPEQTGLLAMKAKEGGGTNLIEMVRCLVRKPRSACGVRCTANAFLSFRHSTPPTPTPPTRRRRNAWKRCEPGKKRS